MKGGKRKMKTRVKLGIIWGAIIVSIMMGINFFYHLLGGERHQDGRLQGFHKEGWQHQGGFEPHRFMNGPHHGGEFHWFGLLLFLIIGLAVLVLLVRWLRRKTKKSAMQQFINTPLVDSHTSVINQNASILDQWEKNVTTKKEND
jgi:hypothetical protein